MDKDSASIHPNRLQLINDIVFVSYNERNADHNWALLRQRFPNAYRIDKISGITNAYRMAGEAADSEFVYIVDADNKILPDFQFDFNPRMESYQTYVFKARNAVNDLEYGYGGIKLYQRITLLDLRTSDECIQSNFMNFHDFPIAGSIKFLDTVASITEFNSSPFDSWKAAFRECCKLETFGRFMHQSELQLRVNQERLNTWLSAGHDRKFGSWVIRGANDGRQYGLNHRDSIDDIALINNYDWLHQTFTQKYQHVFTK